MWILITVVMLNVWAIPADDVLSPNINILEELGKMEARMKSMEKEMEQLRAKNEADDLFSPNINILEELGKMKIMETRMESMEKEMERLRTENTAQTKKLEEFHVTMNDRKIKMDELIKQNEAQAKELDTLRGTTNDVKIKMDDLIKQNEVSKVAFSVSLSSSNGPHSTLQTLIYKHIFLNNGDAYDANTGIFTAPMKGVYVFMVFSKAYGSSDKAVVAGLFRNDQHEISTYARQNGGFIGSSNGVSLLLEKGDKICVNLYPGYWIFDNEHHHSTFSGHLLFPM